LLGIFVLLPVEYITIGGKLQQFLAPDFSCQSDWCDRRMALGIFYILGDRLMMWLHKKSGLTKGKLCLNGKEKVREVPASGSQFIEKEVRSSAAVTFVTSIIFKKAQN
jgi:hypothetical protein